MTTKTTVQLIQTSGRGRHRGKKERNELIEHVKGAVNNRWKQETAIVKGYRGGHPVNSHNRLSEKMEQKINQLESGKE